MLQRARKTPATMMSETVIGEIPALTILIGASAPPSHAPAANPQNTPSACKVRRRPACIGVCTTVESIPVSAELSQEDQARQKHNQRNPELQVAHNRAE